MKIIIFFIVVLVVLFLTKKWWANYLVSIIKNRNTQKTKPLDNPQNGIIFKPSGTVRTFIFALDIEENGDGTVKMSIAKIKEKEL